MRESLLRLSATDSMTGLFNHREFHRRLGEVVSQGERVAVACFDLNDLKQVNDRHGHQAGDEVIQLFASVLQDAASRVPGAIPARLGGDEFAVLLPGSDYEAAERFSKSVARDPRMEEGAARYCPGGRVTVGRGVAAYPGDVEDAGLLLSRADERMYAHKSNGRSFSAKLSSVLTRLDGETTLDEAEAVFEALLGLIDGLDRGLASHSRRVARLAREAAAKMGLSPAEVRLAEIAGKFHDIGKLSVGPSVLRKKEPLTDEERKLIERHPVLGADMLSAVAAMRDIALAVKHHHERWDGTGYPDGLKGEEIPLLARIIAACEVFDAMTRAEFPRKGCAPEAALEEMRASGEFDL
jgi:diguanylate cyclase (GGDEF)-like protein/putative nucleotidyltransferase with HDIG domain